MCITGSGFGICGPTGPLYVLTLPVILIFDAFPAGAQSAPWVTSVALALAGLLYVVVLGVLFDLVFLGIRRALVSRRTHVIKS
jgi:hypothetical protein